MAVRDATTPGDAPLSPRAAEVVLPCADLDRALAFYTDKLGFRLEAIFPADDPRTAVLVGAGLRIRLQRGLDADPGTLRLSCDNPAALADSTGWLTAPNGTRIQLVAHHAPLVVPPVQQSLTVTRLGQKNLSWTAGRAGMRYRDLIPGRQGGRFIASHIHVPECGPVPDYVHHHRVQFQMIYCYRGWVRVVYEDQGPPFVLRPGDCVLQPPHIRHRVLECSAGLEVIEISSPAEHETILDHELALPNGSVSDREFAGQRFVRHQAANASWQPWRVPGFVARDLGIAAATGGLACAHVARPSELVARVCSHDAEFRFLFVLGGRAALHCEGHEAWQLAAGDAFAVPAAVRHSITPQESGLELLEVALPADFALTGDESAAAS